MARDHQTYKLQFGALLGRGGFGEVYQVTSRTGPPLALKLLRQDLHTESQATQRLRDEFRVLYLLRHPHIPSVHDLIEVNGRIGITADFVDGIDLSKALRAEPPLSPRAGAEVIARVADALGSALHTPLGPSSQTTGIVHRDIKPSNIRIGHDGHPWLLDFGIAWTDAFERDAHTSTSVLVGSPAYIAPERFSSHTPTPADDIFGLGCVLYEVLGGKRLLGGLALPMIAQLASQPDHLRALVEDRLADLAFAPPAQVIDLLRAMLHPHPHERPTPHDVAAVLDTHAQRLAGLSLAAWSARHHQSTQPTCQGVWSGQTLTVHSLVGQSPASPWSFAKMLGIIIAGCASGIIATLAIMYMIRLISPIQPANVPPLPQPTHAAVPTQATTTPTQPAKIDAAAPIERPSTPLLPRRSSKISHPAPSPHASHQTPPSRAPSAISLTTLPPKPSTRFAQVDLAPGSPQKVSVKGIKGSYTLPARVPLGTYTIFATFISNQEQPSGVLHVQDEGNLVVQCAMGICRVKP